MTLFLFLDNFKLKIIFLFKYTLVLISHSTQPGHVITLILIKFNHFECCNNLRFRFNAKLRLVRPLSQRRLEDKIL